MKMNLKTWVLTSSACLAFATGAATLPVHMKSITFDPKVVNVKVGDSVEWTNVSLTDHSATADEGAFDTGMVAPKKASKKISFAKAGSFTYHCSMHGKTMSGTVVVEP